MVFLFITLITSSNLSLAKLSTLASPTQPVPQFSDSTKPPEVCGDTDDEIRAGHDSDLLEISYLLKSTPYGVPPLLDLAIPEEWTRFGEQDSTTKLACPFSQERLSSQIKDISKAIKSLTASEGFNTDNGPENFTKTLQKIAQQDSEINSLTLRLKAFYEILKKLDIRSNARDELISKIRLEAAKSPEAAKLLKKRESLLHLKGYLDRIPCFVGKISRVCEISKDYQKQITDLVQNVIPANVIPYCGEQNLNENLNDELGYFAANHPISDGKTITKFLEVTRDGLSERYFIRYPKLLEPIDIPQRIERACIVLALARDRDSRDPKTPSKIRKILVQMLKNVPIDQISEDPCGKFEVKRLVPPISKEDMLSLKEFSPSKIFPNPVDAQPLHVQWINPMSKYAPTWSVQAHILDSMGKPLSRKVEEIYLDRSPNPGIEQITLPSTTDLPAGVYYLKLTKDGVQAPLIRFIKN